MRLRPLAVVVALLIGTPAFPTPGWLGTHSPVAQAQTARGSLSGVVRSGPARVGLPYAVVSIPSLGIERFSGANGVYQLLNVPAGEHELLVRRIGFVPRRFTIRIDAGQSTTLDIDLDQVPVRLTGMTVTPVQRCKNPGVPDSLRSPEVWQLVATLRENAAAYRVLVNNYPFVYVQARAFGGIGDTVAVLQTFDSIAVPGTADVSYRPGRIVNTVAVNNRRETIMRIPTIVELADKQFLANHCFSYGGTEQVGDATWYRLDMRAADKLRSPDVHGTVYLDSATSQLRRLDLELSRPDRLPTQFRGVRTVLAISTFVQIAPGLGIIDGLCAVNWLKPSRGGAVRPANVGHPLELQQSVAYQFKVPPPDVALAGTRPSPGWGRGQAVSRSSLRCAAEP
jgi:hypothetical protein